MTTVAFVRPLQPTGSSETSQYLLEHMAYVMNLEIAMPPATGGWARIVTPAGSRFHAWLPATHAEVTA